VITAEYGGTASLKRQIMNQSDLFYCSGHGDLTGDVEGVGFTDVGDYWQQDLDVVVFSACSVLDINDLNGRFGDKRSPGKYWEQTGPGIFLGYNHSAPSDGGGATVRIVNYWMLNRSTLGDINAWMKANEQNHAWNACAIEKNVKYVFFKKRVA
jgi:hypothetical protein